MHTQYHSRYTGVCMNFHTVIIIYNPNSTGDSETNAKSFAKQLKERDGSIDIKIIATKFAGHAEEIAAEYAGSSDTLIVSSSGDGGYNEVINGVIAEVGTCAVTVLPSGNANDHHRAVAPDDAVESIIKGTVRRIEAIKIEATVNGKLWQRYAHSYVGFGITPKIGKVLTDVRPNVLTEKWHVIKQAFSFKHIKIESDGSVHSYNSLIAATIDRMSKVIKLDESSSLNDGKMEIYESKYLSPFATIKELLSAGVKGVTPTTVTDTFELSSSKSLLVQLDGEVFTLDAKQRVLLTCEKNSITTLA